MVFSYNGKSVDNLFGINENVVILYVYKRFGILV